MFKSFIFWIFDNGLSVIAGAIFVACAFLAYDIHTATDNFAHVYRDYAVVAGSSDTAAYVPSAENNPIRSEMNTVLANILQGKLTPAERLALAKRGLELLAISVKQIDAINARLDATNAAAERMNASSDFVSNLFSKGLPQKIVALAHDRSNAISDIRAYSYRADFDTQRIFQHIVETKGVLSDTYVAELNNNIPAEEEAFNLRTNRYTDLQDIGSEIQRDFADFSKRFSTQTPGE